MMQNSPLVATVFSSTPSYGAAAITPENVSGTMRALYIFTIGMLASPILTITFRVRL